MWEEIIRTQFRLIRKGFNGVGIPDLMIAVTAHTFDKIVFAKDSHFETIAKVFPLRLLEPH
jgi:predicted nucleic acid-binding protein